MELLTKKKIHEISVKELRKVAEIHRTTFYRHYQTPHDVLLEVEYDSIKGFQNTSGPLNDIADLKEHAARMCSYLSENRALVKPFIQNNTDSDITLIFQNYMAMVLDIEEEMMLVLSNSHTHREKDERILYPKN